MRRELVALALLATSLLPSAHGLASVPGGPGATLPKSGSLRHTPRSQLSPSDSFLRAPHPPRLSELRGGGGVAGLWAKYEGLLDSEPLKTRIWSGFIIGIIGDAVCQYLTRPAGGFVLDVKRMLIFAAWGAFGFTPVAFKWYSAMEGAVPKDLPFRFLVKTILDQTIFSTGITSITFMCITIVEGLLSRLEWKLNALPNLSGPSALAIPQLVEEGWVKVTRNLWPTLVENWKVWPAVQLLNFSVVPVKFQVLFVNLVAIWWNFVLSMMQHK